MEGVGAVMTTGPVYDSEVLTNAVADRLSDVPSHTVISIHRIVKEALDVLEEWGFLEVVGTKGDDG